MNYYDFALKDLKSASTMYNHTEEYDVVVVSCQQYLEKSLKYLLELKSGELSKTHKLTTLSNRLDIEEFKQYEDLFRKIQDYYFDKRYPSEDYIETTKEECDLIYNKTLELKIIIENISNKLISQDFTKKIDFFDI